MSRRLSSIGSFAFRIEVYQTSDKSWRWRAVAQSNGQIVADGGEGYTRRAACAKEALKLTCNAWPVTELIADDARKPVKKIKKQPPSLP